MNEDAGPGVKNKASIRFIGKTAKFPQGRDLRKTKP
jgi:hypothetical protein